MTKNTHLTKLTELQKNYAAEVAAVDKDLSAEGEAKRVQRVRDKYRTDLDQTRRAFEAEVALAKQSATNITPKPLGDTGPAWQRAQMLLDAGQSLSEVVAQADAPMLHALSEWGPTWVQAQAVKTTGKSLGEALSRKPADVAPLQNSIRHRWAEVLGGSKAGTILETLALEATAAEFDITADHLVLKLDGSSNPGNDMERALAAHYAGQQAATTLGTANDDQESGEAA